MSFFFSPDILCLKTYMNILSLIFEKLPMYWREIPYRMSTTIILAYMHHGPLTRYVKLRITHAPGRPGTFSPPPRVSDPDMHHSTCVTHVPLCTLGSLTSGFFWSRWRGKRSRHSGRMHNPQFNVCGDRPMELDHHWLEISSVRVHLHAIVSKLMCVGL